MTTNTKLPEANYYRAAALGNGAYGAVCIAYDDDGNEWAAKLFWDENGEEEDDDCWDDDYNPTGGVDCGILREIAMLRLLNGAHPNVLSMHDVSRMNDKDATLALVMPKQAGSLSSAIEKQSLGNKEKLKVAALSLHALAFLHSHGIIHRDIKPDNLLMDADGAPVLADFSLAKVVGGKADAQAAAKAAVGDKKLNKKDDKKRRRSVDASAGAPSGAPVLTASMGTPTYTAPEIVNGESYGVKADVFSMGVVFLELFTGEALDAEKNKHALEQLNNIRSKLSKEKPIPKMLHAMLEPDPSKRVTAEEALQMLPSIEKVVPVMPAIGELLLPSVDTNAAVAAAAAGTDGKRRKLTKKNEEVIAPARLCKLLGAESEQTLADAQYLYERSEAARSNGLEGSAACALIACKISETETFHPDDVWNLTALKDSEYDSEGYPALELEILSEVGYAVISRTAAVAADGGAPSMAAPPLATSTNVA